MARHYELERGRLWQRLYQARERLNLLTARRAAGLDLTSGMKIEEVLVTHDLRVWLRAIQYRAHAYPTRSNIAADFDDLIGVASDHVRAGTDATPGFVDGANDILEEAFAAREEWEKGVNSAPTP